MSIRSTRTRRGAVLLTALCALAGCGSPRTATAHGNTARPGPVPDTLIAAGKQVLFMARGEGVQIYVARETGEGLQWVLQAPRAVLFDFKTGEPIGTHSAGPTWVANDGGTLTGTTLASKEAPNGEGVPWLLLEVTSANGGRFSKVVNIQRLDTWGGRAPAIAPTRTGETREVRYEATYVFLGNREK